MNTQKLEQAIEHIDKALELINRTYYNSLWKELFLLKEALWDKIDEAEELQELFDESDRQRGLTK
jgi:hypothetical protein